MYKVQVIKNEPCMINLAVEIPNDEVLLEKEQVLNQLQSTASLPGFRKGKSPRELVEKNYTQTLRDKTVTNLIDTAIVNIVKDRQLRVSGTPVIDDLKFEFTQPLTFHVKIEFIPEFEPKGYKNLKLTRKKIEVTEQEIDDALKNIQQNSFTLSDDQDGIVKENCVVTVGYYLNDTGTTKSVLFTQRLVDMGHPEIDMQLYNLLLKSTSGEFKDTTVNFPASHPDKKFAGKTVPFKIKIERVQKKVYPELNDTFAQMYKISTLSELKEKIREEIVKKKTDEVRTNLEDQIATQLLKHNPIVVPPNEIELRLTSFLDRLEKLYQQQGGGETSWKDKVPELREKYRPEAERTAKLGLVYFAVAKKENLELKDEKIIQFMLENAVIQDVR